MLASWLLFTTFIIEPRLAWERVKSIAVPKLISLTEGKHPRAFWWRQVWYAF
jgi:hypothetical protein